MPGDNDITLNLTPMQCRLVLEALIAVGNRRNNGTRSQSETVRSIVGQINTQLPPAEDTQEEDSNDSTW